MKPFINPDHVDPKLKIAKEEIQQILDKHDLYAAFILGSETHVEQFLNFSSKSCTTPVQGGLRFKANSKTPRQGVRQSISWVYSVRDSLQLMWYEFDQLIEDVISKHFEVVQKPFGEGMSPDE